MKKTLALLLAVAMLITLIPSVYADKTNIAQGKTATSNVNDNNQWQNGKAKAVDGDVSTESSRWVSASTTDAYLELDLGGTYTFDSAEVYSGYNKTSAFIKNFKIEYYEDSEWKVAYEVSGSGAYKQEAEFTAVTSDKVRLHILNSPSDNIRLYEFMLFEAEADSGITAPRNVAVDSKTDSSVTISWDAVETQALVGYKLYKDGALEDTVNTTSYTFEGLDDNTEYVLGVSAYSADDETEITTVTVTTNASAASITEIDMGLTYTATKSDICLSWDAVLGASSYDVYRDGTYYTTVNTNSYSDTGIVVFSATSMPACASGVSHTYYVTTGTNKSETLTASTLPNIAMTKISDSKATQPALSQYYTHNNAFDGTFTDASRWICNVNTTSVLWVELDGYYAIPEFMIYTGAGTMANSFVPSVKIYAGTADCEGLNDETAAHWTDLGNYTMGVARNNVVLTTEASAKYLRFEFAPMTSGDPKGARIYELQIFGAPTAAPVVPVDELQEIIDNGGSVTESIDCENNEYNLNSAQELEINKGTLKNAVINTGSGSVIIDGITIKGAICFDGSGNVYSNVDEVLTLSKGTSQGLMTTKSITPSDDLYVFTLTTGDKDADVTFDNLDLNGNVVFGITVNNVPVGTFINFK